MLMWLRNVVSQQIKPQKDFQNYCYFTNVGHTLGRTFIGLLTVFHSLGFNLES